jgi:hypothetical protein
MVSDIFVSYAREDETRIAQLARALASTGKTVFWDRHIPAGKSWRTWIGRALEGARCVVVAWTRSSVESEWVIAEAEEARRRGVLVPVLLDRVDPPLGFRQIQAADLSACEIRVGDEVFDLFLRDLEVVFDAGDTLAAVSPTVVVPTATPLPPTDAAPSPSPERPLSEIPTASGKHSEAGEEPRFENALQGRVVERLDAPPYSYLRLRTAKGEVWAAVPKSDIAAGREITVTGAMPMTGFESKSLKRKFETIYFGTLAGVDPPATSRADVRTVAEIHAQRVALEEKLVTVRGKVAKFNEGIMGRNWIHLRDGTGRSGKDDDDLAVTTADRASVGDVVVATGTVRIDRDFGSGYAYSVIVEDAKLSK